MDEHAVRIRAGLLNVITWVAIMNVFYMRDLLLANVIFSRYWTRESDEVETLFCLVLFSIHI